MEVWIWDLVEGRMMARGLGIEGSVNRRFWMEMLRRLEKDEEEEEKERL